MKYVLQCEFDNEPAFIVPVDSPDSEFITIAPGNYDLARRILAFLNSETD